MQEIEIEDRMRGSLRKITIRIHDAVKELPCDAKYDGALSGLKGNRVRVPEKIEVLENGEWKPYPSASWLDGVESDDQLITRVIAKITGEEGYDIMDSPEGLPDGTLMMNAKKENIFTQYLG